ncbi:MAG TPA: hypothetical protein VF444_17870 [Pseudonocardiaceae bacterium]
MTTTVSVERARRLLEIGRAADAVPILSAHLADHPARVAYDCT